MKTAKKITATKAHYIKLGKGGKYEQFCIDNGKIALGFYEVPHEEPFDPETVFNIYKEKDRDDGTCTRYQNQVSDFYTSDKDTLWVTFADGKLYWCFAKEGVEYLGSDKTALLHGSRHLTTIDGWHDCDINGNKLSLNKLSGSLTKTGRYPSTICTLQPQLEYLLRRINCEDLPEITTAKENRENIISSIITMMKLLNPKDFELLVELAFAQSGWQRLSATGGTQKTIDIEMYLPSLKERAFVQVKSKTNQKELEKYEDELKKYKNPSDQRDTNYIFYVYHTSEQELKSKNKTTKLVDAKELAEMVLRVGLFDWLLEKAR